MTRIKDTALKSYKLSHTHFFFFKRLQLRAMNAASTLYMEQHSHLVAIKLIFFYILCMANLKSIFYFEYQMLLFSIYIVCN